MVQKSSAEGVLNDLHDLREHLALSDLLNRQPVQRPSLEQSNQYLCSWSYMRASNPAPKELSTASEKD